MCLDLNFKLTEGRFAQEASAASVSATSLEQPSPRHIRFIKTMSEKMKLGLKLLRFWLEGACVVVKAEENRRFRHNVVT